jgi:AraC-like DNA-binding protein
MNLPIAIGAGGLRHFRHFESDDVDDTCARISEVLKPHSLRPTGNGGMSKAVMNLARFAGIGMTTIDFGAGMQVDAGASSDYYVIILCLRGHAEAQVNGEAVPLKAGEGVLGEPGWWLNARFSADCEQFLVRINAQSFASNAGVAPRFRNRFDLRRPELLPWLQQVALIANSAQTIRSLQSHELAAASMEKLLIALLMAGQPWRDTATAAARSIAPHCVRKAEAVIEARAGEPLRLGDIAAAVGVPPRTLQDGFRRFRDYTPVQFLTAIRLERARRDLQAADDNTLVRQVAMEWGFPHFGRFAQAYRRRFGEPPSATLRRATH